MRFSFLIALALLLPGCATLQPWEKEPLAGPEMQFVQKNSGRFFIDHAMIALEQAEGGNGRAGGGCGCR